MAELGRHITQFSSQRLLSEVMMTFLFRTKLKAVFKALRLEESKDTVISSIPITCIQHFPHPNAMAALTPRGDPFILVDSKFSACFHAMVKLVLQRARPKQQKGDTGSVKSLRVSDTDLATYLKQLGAYVFSDQQEPLPIIPMPDTEEVQVWSSMLVHGLETFIVCHELSHHLLGHEGFAVEARGKMTELDGKVLARFQNEELEADTLGAQLSYAVFDFYRDKNKAAEAEVPPTFAREIFAAPDIFCTFLDVWETSWGMGWPADTHPPGGVRREKIRKVFSNTLPPEVVEFAKGMQAICESIASIA